MGKSDLYALIGLLAYGSVIGLCIWRASRQEKKNRRAIWQVVVKIHESEAEIWGGDVFSRVRHLNISISKVYAQLNAWVAEGRLESYTNNELTNSNVPARTIYCMPVNKLWSSSANMAHRAVLDIIILNDEGVTIEAICESTNLKPRKVLSIIDRMVAEDWVTSSTHRLTGRVTYLVKRPADA